MPYLVHQFEEELKRFLTQIEKEDIPSNFTTFYENYTKTNEVVDKKITTYMANGRSTEQMIFCISS